MEGRLVTEKVIKRYNGLPQEMRSLCTNTNYFFLLQGIFKEVYLQAMKDFSLFVLVNLYFPIYESNYEHLGQYRDNISYIIPQL